MGSNKRAEFPQQLLYMGKEVRPLTSSRAFHHTFGFSFTPFTHIEATVPQGDSPTFAPPITVGGLVLMQGWHA